MSNEQTKHIKPNRLTGSRLGTRGIVAQAMLEDGASLSTVRKATGISETTASFLKKHKVLPREQVDAVKRSLQDKFALVASQALEEATDPGKLHDAGFGELVRGAAVAADRAGLTQVSAIDHLTEALSKFQKAKPQAASSDPQTLPVHALPAPETREDTSLN